MKKINTVLLMLAFMLSIWQAKAQPFIYTTVSAGSQTLTGVTLSDSVTWFRWSNSYNHQFIDIKMYVQGAQYTLSNAQVYIDYGTSFERVATATMRTDSLIDLSLSADPGSDIYLRIPTAYCGTCTATAPRVGIVFKDVASNCIGTPTNCDLVIDGAMEQSNLNCSYMSLGQMPCYWNIANPDTAIASLGTFHSTLYTLYGSSDYYNSCAPTAIGGCAGLQCVVNSNTNFTTDGLGNIAPHSGNGYCGIYMYSDSSSVYPISDPRFADGGYDGRYREYLTQKLNSPMLAGVPYTVGMWVRIGNTSKYAIANFHVLATASPVKQPIDTIVQDVINIPIPAGAGAFLALPGGVINDTTQWTYLSATITPSVTSQYITIGNFYNKGNTAALDRSTGHSWTYGDATSLFRHRGFAYYYFDDISIKPTIVARDTNINICAGDTYTLGLPGSSLPTGITYTWTATPSDPTLGAQTHNAQPIVIPTATTVYQLTTSGCSLSPWTVTLTVNAVPSVSVVSSATAICAGDSATLTASGATNYGWQPVPLSGASIVVTPTITTTYTVTGDNGGVCTNAATVQVIFMGLTCCQAPNATIGTSPTSTVSAGGTYASQIIDIQGVVNFTVNTTFNSCTLRMAPNSRIQVSAGTTITLNNTKVFSCTGLWDGIVLLRSGLSAANIITTRSRIEDAYQAISIDWANNNAAGTANGSISVGSTLFNNDYIGVSINNSPNITSYPVVVGTSTFNTVYSPTSPQYGLKPGVGYTYAYNKIQSPAIPYTSFPIGYAGISINNVGTKIVIGDSTGTSSSPNYFNNLNYGVMAVNSDVWVHDNSFNQLRGSDAYASGTTTLAPVGIGVYAVNTGTLVGKKKLWVGTGTVTPVPFPATSPYPKSNDFNNCYMGVYAADQAKVIINGNSFETDTTYLQPCAGTVHGACINPTSPTYFSLTGNNAVFVKGLIGIGQTNHNYITDHRSGITMGLNTAAPTASAAYTQQNNNVITTVDDNTTKYCMYGINISQANVGVTLNYNKYQIIGNDINSVYNCINAINVKGSLLIQNNVDIGIELNNTLGFSGTYRSGIKLTSCDGAVIAGNVTMNGNGTVTSSNYPYARGIWLQNSGNNAGFTGSKVNCNTLSNLGRTVMFTGSCLNQTAKNDMTNHFQGLVLSNNGIIGQQGSASVTNDNLWHTLGSGSSAIEGETYIENTSNVNTNSILFVKPNGTAKYTPTFNYASINPVNAYSSAPGQGIRILTSSITGVTCESDGGGGGGHKMSSLTYDPMSNTAANSGLYESLADENTPYAVYGTEASYQNQRLVYRLIAMGSVSPDSITPPTLAFYNGSQNSSYAQYLNVDKAIEAGDLASAAAINNAAPANSTIEAYQQSINALIIKYEADPTYVYSTSERNALYMIANECMERYGNVVAQARALVYVLENQWRDFPEKCKEITPSDNHKKAGNANTKPVSETSIVLYPNPNRGVMTLDYALVDNKQACMKLYTISGQQVGVYPLEGTRGKTEINENALQNGVYYYTILNGNSLIKTEKVIIIK